MAPRAADGEGGSQELVSGEVNDTRSCMSFTGPYSATAPSGRVVTLFNRLCL